MVLEANSHHPKSKDNSTNEYNTTYQLSIDYHLFIERLTEI